MGKRVKGKGALMVLVAALMFVFSSSIESKAEAKYFEVKPTVESKTKVKLSWKKKSVSGYEVYRATVSSSGKVGKDKRIAVISGKSTSYIDKISYKKTYIYKVKGYKKTGSKKTYTYEAISDEVFAGVSETCWSEYLESDAEISTGSIKLVFGVMNGMEPSGYDIYRSVRPFGYKKIARVKAGKIGQNVVYKDENVTATMSYFYQVRAYKKIGGKTIYGKYSVPIQLSAVNQSGKYKVESLTENNQKVKNIALAITSNDAGNADLIIDGDAINEDLSYNYKKTNADDYEIVNVKAVKYSYDNKTWCSLENREIVLKAEKTVYFMFEKEDGSEFFYAGNQAEQSELTGWKVGYNDLRSYLDIDLKKQMAETRIDGEYYH